MGKSSLSVLKAPLVFIPPWNSEYEMPPEEQTPLELKYVDSSPFFKAL